MKQILLLVLTFSLSHLLTATAQNIVLGPVTGAVTHVSARIFIRSNQAGEVQVQLDTDAGFSNPLTFTDSIRTLKDTSAIISVNNLQASTLYYCRYFINQQQDTVISSFKTFPQPGAAADFSFAFGSCMKGADMTPLFSVMNAHQPDLFIQLGDFTYPDAEDDFSEQFDLVTAAYHAKYSYPGITPVLRSTPLAYVYDDHDYADNNTSRNTQALDGSYTGPNGLETVLMDAPLGPHERINSINGWLDYFPGYSAVDTSEGLYHSFTIGNAEFFFLDNRSARSPNNEAFFYDSTDVSFPWEFSPPPGHTILGAQQMQWLLNGLENSTAKWKFLLSGTTFNKALKRIIRVGLGFQRNTLDIGGSGGSGMTMATGFADGWPGFPADQDTLINFIRSNNIRNVILLSGDTHTSAMDDGTNSGIPEFNSSAMGVDESKVRLYHIMDSVGSLIGQPPVLDSLWNKGGSGLGNTNFHTSFGKVEVFGNDSIRMCIVDREGTVFNCWTFEDGFVAGLNETANTKKYNQLEVFPNPASAVMNIQFTGFRPGADYSFTLYDISGKVVLTKEDITTHTFTIDVSKLQAGNYLCTLTEDGNEKGNTTVVIK
ncbi:MAG: alkaline phosphatase D family protein [Bacteroidia bacterium]